jgi:hypothetical protein
MEKTSGQRKQKFKGRCGATDMVSRAQTPLPHKYRLCCHLPPPILKSLCDRFGADLLPQSQQHMPHGVITCCTGPCARGRHAHATCGNSAWNAANPSETKPWHAGGWGVGVAVTPPHQRMHGAATPANALVGITSAYTRYLSRMTNQASAQRLKCGSSVEALPTTAARMCWQNLGFLKAGVRRARTSDGDGR